MYPCHCSKSHAMRLIRFGEEVYSRMLLEVQTALIGLKDWEQVLSPEEKSQTEELRDVDKSGSEEFVRAKGELR